MKLVGKYPNFKMQNCKEDAVRILKVGVTNAEVSTDVTKILYYKIEV